MMVPASGSPVLSIEVLRRTPQGRRLVLSVMRPPERRLLMELASPELDRRWLTVDSRRRGSSLNNRRILILASMIMSHSSSRGSSHLYRICAMVS